MSSYVGRQVSRTEDSVANCHFVVCGIVARRMYVWMLRGVVGRRPPHSGYYWLFYYCGFCVYAPVVWNSLPRNLRLTDIADRLQQQQNESFCLTLTRHIAHGRLMRLYSVRFIIIIIIIIVLRLLLLSTGCQLGDRVISHRDEGTGAILLHIGT